MNYGLVRLCLKLNVMGSYCDFIGHDIGRRPVRSLEWVAAPNQCYRVGVSGSRHGRWNGKNAIALTQKRRVRWHSQSADIRRMCLWGDQPLAVRSVQAAWTDICSVITSSLQIGGLDDNFDALLTLKIAILKRRSHSLHRNTKIQGLNILSTTLDCSNKERIDST